MLSNISKLLDDSLDIVNVVSRPADSRRKAIVDEIHHCRSNVKNRVPNNFQLCDLCDKLSLIFDTIAEPDGWNNSLLSDQRSVFSNILTDYVNNLRINISKLKTNEEDDIHDHDFSRLSDSSALAKSICNRKAEQHQVLHFLTHDLQKIKRRLLIAQSVSSPAITGMPSAQGFTEPDSKFARYAEDSELLKMTQAVIAAQHEPFERILDMLSKGQPDFRIIERIGYSESHYYHNLRPRALQAFYDSCPFSLTRTRIS